jgi:hypothetical protein
MPSTNSAIIIGTLDDTSPAVAGTAAGGDIVEGLRSFQSIDLFATLRGAVGGTLDVWVQSRHGATWYDLAHFPQLAAAAPAIVYRLPLSRYGDVVAAVVIGTGLVPILAVNVAVPGDFGDALRLVYTAGGGTNAGAVQSVQVCGTLLKDGNR